MTVCEEWCVLRNGERVLRNSDEGRETVIRMQVQVQVRQVPGHERGD